MAEIPSYATASFKGITFDVVSSDVEIGRRGVLHEYVNEDLPYFEDMGRKAHRYTVEAYFRGVDHLTDAKRLQAALERDQSAGQLVLPNRTRETVYCIEANRSESLKDTGGETTFSLTFIEAGEFRFPASIFDTIADLFDTAAAIIADYADFVTYNINSAQFAIDAITNAVTSTRATIIGLGFSNGTIPQMAGYMSAVGESGTAVQSINALLDLADFESAVEPTHDGPQAASEYADALAYDVAFRNLAAIHAAQAATRLEFTNRAEAIDLRDRILAALERDLGELSSDQVKSTIDIRSRFMVDIARRIVTLPAFLTVNLRQSCPSVVAAHLTLGDYTREADLRGWNPAIHPLFMPPVLEVIRD